MFLTLLEAISPISVPAWSGEDTLVISVYERGERELSEDSFTRELVLFKRVLLS